MFAARKERKEKKEKKEKRVVKKRACPFCTNKDLILDYRMIAVLNDYITERCKISPRRGTGACRYHQNKLVREINRARQLALLPYTIQHAIRDF